MLTCTPSCSIILTCRSHTQSCSFMLTCTYPCSLTLVHANSRSFTHSSCLLTLILAHSCSLAPINTHFHSSILICIIDIRLHSSILTCTHSCSLPLIFSFACSFVQLLTIAQITYMCNSLLSDESCSCICH